jgi:hypothetical protein
VAAVDSGVEVAVPPSAPALVDAESREWIRCLCAHGAVKEEAVARLHAVLVRAARFEVARRRPSLPHLRGDELDDIANEAVAASAAGAGRVGAETACRSTSSRSG